MLGLDKAQMVQMSTGIVMLYQRSLLTTRPSGEWIQSFTDRFSMLQGDGYLRLWERTIICQGINTIKAITRTSREGSYGEILD